MKVLVIYGGTSDEREVSLRSGENIADALRQAGYKSELYDPADPEGNLAQASQGCDVIFPALHGAGGEDGTIQQQLERLGAPYVGCDVDSSELCFDKWNYRTLLQSYGLPVAKGALVDRKTVWDSSLIKSPFVLKPPKGGSSIDTTLVHDTSGISKAAVEANFDRHLQLLMEELIAGTEITVAVLDDQALPVIEIIPPSGKDFDYENKYNGESQELCPPQHVDVEIQSKARALAERIHGLCGCRDMSRTDMIVRPDSSIVVLETNTIPGLTRESLLPKAAAAAGIGMPELCDRLVKMALGRG